MNIRAIDVADSVVRRYKTRNPEEIISRRAIKLKDIRFCHDLLGYYTVLLNCEYIGINPNCTDAQRISALAHELGHAFFDRTHASSARHSKTPIFIVWTTPRQNGEQTHSPLNSCWRTMMSSSSSAAYRAMKYQELLQEFLYTHGGVLTPAKIAQKNEIEKHFVDFKLNILAAKGYQLPVLPELHNDRLCLCEKYFRFFVIIQNNNYVLEIQSILYVYHIIFM